MNAQPAKLRMCGRLLREARLAGEKAFESFDLASLWEDTEYSTSSYMEPAPSDELIASIEAELGGFKLPAAYVELARVHNGGVLGRRSCHPMSERTGWAENHIAIRGLYAIGRTVNYSLCGERGSKFWEEWWEYPPIGIYFADTPAGGHEMLALDYRACGKRGEPSVVYVHQENDFAITFVAPDFASFIRGLVDEKVYDTSEEDRKAAFAAVERGSFSPIVVRALRASSAVLPEGERVLRRLGFLTVEEKGHFSLHDDQRSYLMYDFMFWLYSHLRTAASYEDFVRPPGKEASYDTPCYEMMIVAGLLADPYGFCTRGYAPGFVRGWWDARIASGDIARSSGGYHLTPQAEAALVRRLAAVIG